MLRLTLCALRYGFPLAVAAALAGPTAAAQDVDSAAVDAAAQAEAASAARKAAAEETRYRYETHWTEQMESGAVAEAVQTATSWLNDAIAQFDEGALETYVPLMRLGESQYLASDIEGSIDSHNQAVDIAEREFGPVSIALVEPLLRLGRIHQNLGDHETAIPLLLRAKDLTHRNAGIFNREQESIVEMLTASFQAVGDERQATREQRFLFETAERTYADDDPRMVPALEKWARYNAGLDRLSTARALYERALAILDQAYGENNLQQMPLLNSMARTMGRGGETGNDFFPRAGADALRRAVDVYEAQEYVDQSDVLRAKGRLGDWYMRNDRRNNALDIYQQAVDAALASGVDGSLVDREFGAPRLLMDVNSTIGMTTAGRVETHSKPSKIVFRYDVDERGAVRNVEIIEDTVGAISAARLLRGRLSNARFRPRFVDGRAVPTFDLRYEIVFTPEQPVAAPANSEVPATAAD